MFPICREESIKRCITVVGDRVKDYRARMDSGDADAVTNLRATQSTVGIGSLKRKLVSCRHCQELGHLDGNVVNGRN